MTRRNADRPIRDRTEDGPGVWIPAERVSPLANIAGRLFRTKDGTIQRYYGPGAMNYHGAPEAWFFPDDITDAEVVPPDQPRRWRLWPFAVAAALLAVAAVAWGWNL